MSSDKPQKTSSGLEAARWLLEQQRRRDAFSGQDEPFPRPPPPRGPNPLSTRSVAKRFGVSKSAVGRQLRALKSGKRDAGAGPRTGRPSKLTDAEDYALAFHVSMLRKEGRPVTQRVVRNAANELLARRPAPAAAAPVSNSWVARWWRAAARRDGVAGEADVADGGSGLLEDDPAAAALQEQEGEAEEEEEEEESAEEQVAFGYDASQFAVVQNPHYNMPNPIHQDITYHPNY